MNEKDVNIKIMNCFLCEYRYIKYDRCNNSSCHILMNSQKKPILFKSISQISNIWNSNYLTAFLLCSYRWQTDRLKLFDYGLFGSVKGGHCGGDWVISIIRWDGRHVVILILFLLQTRKQAIALCEQKLNIHQHYVNDTSVGREITL